MLLGLTLFSLNSYWIMDEEMMSRSSHRFRLCVLRRQESSPGCLPVINENTVNNNNSMMVTSLPEGLGPGLPLNPFLALVNFSLSTAWQGLIPISQIRKCSQGGAGTHQGGSQAVNPGLSGPPARSTHLTTLPPVSHFPDSSVFNS